MIRFACLLLALAALPSSAADPPRRTIAILDVELADDQGDLTYREAELRRLAAATRQLQTSFRERGLYEVVDTTPAAAVIAQQRERVQFLYNCNGCAEEIGRALKVDRVLTPWVQKVSNLILNFNVEIKDAATGTPVLTKSVDLRGNTDESWSRAVNYLVRDMVEKGQGGR